MLISSTIRQLWQKFWRRSFPLFLIGILTVSLYACRPVSANLKSTLVIPTPSGPATFNFPLNQSAYNIFGYIYEGLLTENGITSKLEPALAESWEISPDGQKIVFTLRQNLKWSDGQPLTTDDVVFSYNQVYLNQQIPSGLGDILKIGKKGEYPTVKKLDEQRVEFTIPEPFAPFLRFAGGLSILPAHALREATNTFDSQGKLKFLSTWGTDTHPQEIVGNGMFRIVNYTPNQRVILEKNPYYWRKDAQGKSQPYIDKIVWQIIENSDRQLLSFRSGSLDVLDVPAESYQLLKRGEKRGKYTIYNGGPDTGTTFLAFNLNQAKNAENQPLVDPIKSRWFNTKQFRQAIAYGINREVMKNNLYRGLGALQHSSLPVQNPFYLSPEQGLKTYPYDPEKAKQLLLSVGFKYDEQGQLFDPEGNRVRFNILTSAGRKVRELMFTQIQEDLAQIGIKVDGQFLAFNTYVEKIRLTRDWDTYLGGFSGGGVEPHGGYNVWSVRGSLHSFNQGPQLGEPPLKDWKVQKWEQKIDDLYVQASQELQEEKRKELYAETQRIISEEVPFLYMVNPLNLQAIRNRISNLKYTVIGGPFWNLYELTMEE